MQALCHREIQAQTNIFAAGNIAANGLLSVAADSYLNRDTYFRGSDNVTRVTIAGNTGNISASGSITAGGKIALNGVTSTDETISAAGNMFLRGPSSGSGAQIPYFSSIKLVLFPGVTQVAVQDNQGRQGTQLVAESPQIKTTITGWINNQVVRQDVFVFDAEPVDTPSMSDVLDKAKVLGVDVAETWTAAFDQIAEVFPQTAEQPGGTNGIGPAVYLRPDAFESNRHPTLKKSITVKVGVYSDAEYTKLQTYLNLTFADGETKREREANLASLVKAKSDIQCPFLSRP